MAIRFTGLASGLDTESIIQDLMEVENMRVERVEKKKTLVEWKKEAWEEMNSEIYSFFKEELFDFKSSSTYNQKKLTSSNESVVSLKDSSSAILGTHNINVTDIASGSFLTGSKLVDGTSASSVIASSDGVINISLDDGSTFETVNVTAGDTVSDVVNKIKELDLDINVSYDSKFNRIFMSSKDTGADKQILLEAGNAGGDKILDALGFDNGSDDITISTNRKGSAGANAEFTYNGASFTSESNEVTVNGLSFVITGAGDTTISVSQDTDAIYNSIKSFVNKYNDLQAKINEKIDAEYVSNDYEPLTDEEKEAMSDDEIELWENKIKDSILRRDDILTNLSYTMRTALTTSSYVASEDLDELEYKYLSDLGIITGLYTENGKLHIEGDEDDDLYGLNENKLRQAIEDNPEDVAEFFSKLGDSLYEQLSEKMKSTTLSSALTFYNDKYLNEQLEDYADEIYDLEDQLLEIEERYYSQFTAMEQAIQQANSTASWLSQQLGGL